MPGAEPPGVRRPPPRSALPGRNRHKGPRKILGLVPRPRGTDGHRLPLLLGALPAATLPPVPEDGESKALNPRECAPSEAGAFRCPSWGSGRATPNAGEVGCSSWPAGCLLTQQNQHGAKAGASPVTSASVEPPSNLRLKAARKQRGLQIPLAIFSWVSLGAMELHSSPDIQRGLTTYFFWVELVK